jgi:RNase P/RNase MRP subunit POP5
MEWNEATYAGPVSSRQRRRRRVAYRVRAPAPPVFNRFQRIIWRGQRLVLGDNGRRRRRRAARRALKRSR